MSFAQICQGNEHERATAAMRTSKLYSLEIGLSKAILWHIFYLKYPTVHSITLDNQQRYLKEVLFSCLTRCSSWDILTYAPRQTESWGARVSLATEE